jgi:predicted Ser/Thr protein kinase
MPTPLRSAPAEALTSHAPEPNPYPFLLPPVTDDEIGRLGSYRVLGLLGKGGMGYVFRAEDVALARPVALKVMKPGLDGDVCGWQRFLREARAMAAIKHDSLVTVYQVGQERDVVYLAMELLEGASLDDWLARGKRPKPGAVVRVAREIAGGLVVIHARGLVHRDLKPANIWVEASGGRVKILDFGLARFMDDDASITKTGVVLGTPCFMSPEQARGEPAGPQSDLFSFGGVLYALCTGQNPFRGDNATAVLTSLAVDDPQPAHELNPAVPRPLSDLIMQLLAKSPDDRPSSAEAVLKRLMRLGATAVPITADRPAVPPAATPAITADTAGPTCRTDKPRPKRKRPAGRRRWWIGVAVAAALAIAVALPAIAWVARRPAVGSAASAATNESAQTFLSDLEPVGKENWPFLPPPPPGRPQLRPIGDVSVKGQPSPHGILMHPAPPWDGPTRLTYSLGGAFKTFRAQVSLNDGPGGSENPCTFVVLGDGKPLWTSQPVSSQADAQPVDVPVSGVDRLTIEVRCAGEPRAAHAVWVEPSLAK